ncbi:MAG: DNA methyltransferase [Archangium gephyra]|uniref:DNA methyltransferase n=1 Tax=Archangium gephyra TaxID=48 RepID=A0A2W5SUV7_9BACT|nr:MAG: DNA methyltransferase [Archangium gephyra]
MGPTRLSTAASTNLALPLGAVLAPEESYSFRPIHYLGSKLRITGPIIDAINELARPNGSACDLFAGSGTVSLALSAHRPVTAVDIQEYSRVVCSAMLAPVRGPKSPSAMSLVAAARESEFFKKLSRAVAPLVDYEKECIAEADAGNPEPLCDFVEYASLLAFDSSSAEAKGRRLATALRSATKQLAKEGLSADQRAILTRYYGGVYFSVAQAAELDALLDVAHGLPLRQRDYFLAMVLSTASEIVNTVGKQFAQPIRPRDAQGQPKRHLTRQIIRDRAREPRDAFLHWAERYDAVPRASHRHQTIRADYRDFLKAPSSTPSVVYADPPYTRDHYSRFYHVLETMCLRDNPTVSTMRLGQRDVMSRGFYRVDRHQSPFCIKSQAPAAFTALFEGVKRLNAPLVVSYSPFQSSEGGRPRLMTIDGLVELAEKSFKRVEVRSVGRYAHNKLNQTQRNARVFYDAEVLLLCSG